MTHTLNAAALDARRFTAAQCEALFQAVLVDDVVDAHTALPERITLDHDQALLIDCYRLDRQWWKEGVDRRALIALVDKLRGDRDLPADDRLAFKYARARFKHLRFACALFRDTHKYPVLFDGLTIALGHLQDGFKNGLRGKVYRDSVLCRLFLTRGVYALLAREIDHLSPSTPSGFRSYTAQQVAALEAVLSRGDVTGAQFHATRKIVSRQSAFYATVLTITGGDEAYKMSRSIAAINGLMGSMHDVLVEQRVAGTHDYHRTPFVLPEEIRERLGALVARYRQSGLR